MANYYVSGNRSNGYNIKKEGASRASEHFELKEKAESRAKMLSFKSGGGEVRIQGPNGRIMDSDTIKPGNDPCPPRDRKY